MHRYTHIILTRFPHAGFNLRNTIRTDDKWKREWGQEVQEVHTEKIKLFKEKKKETNGIFKRWKMWSENDQTWESSRDTWAAAWEIKDRDEKDGWVVFFFRKWSPFELLRFWYLTRWARTEKFDEIRTNMWVWRGPVNETGRKRQCAKQADRGDASLQEGVKDGLDDQNSRYAEWLAKSACAGEEDV